MSSPRIRPGSRLAAWPALLILAAAACGDPAGPDPQPNRPPAAVGTIPDLTLQRGEATTVEVSGYFSDPDGGTLQYEASTSDGTVVSVSISGSNLMLLALADGAAVVIVTALDPGGLATQQTFLVMVPAPPIVELAADATAAPESGSALVELVLSAPPPTPITIAYTLGTDEDAGTMDADAADFADGLTGTVEIAAGATEAAIEIAFVDDEDIEPTRETFTLTLDAPAINDGYDLGPRTFAVGTIEEGICDRTPEVADAIAEQLGNPNCAAIDDRGLARVTLLSLSASRSAESWLESAGEPTTTACDADGWFSTDGIHRPGLPGGSSECEDGPPYSTRSGSAPAAWQGGNAGLTSLKNGDFDGLSNLTFLLIGDSELSELPAEVFSDLEQLQYLILSGNRLAVLPEAIFSGLSSLQFLFLDGNVLTEFPAGLTSLSKLQVLNLTANRLAELPDKMFADLASLQIVLLANNQLARLPADGPSSSGLEHLDLANNQLIELPPGWLAGATGLISLNLAGNQLAELPPAAFSGLANLRDLKLFGNQLTELPDGVFSGLVVLQELHLWGNRLTKLPDGVFSGLANLSILYLARNELAAPPPGTFSDLTELRRLALDENPIGELSADIFQGLSNLERLWLTDTGLKELPQGIFADLSKLELLSLAINEIAELPSDVFAELSNLTLLYLLQNQLSELPSGSFAGLAGMRLLNLSDNLLTALPAGMFVGLTSLEQVALKGNPGAPFALKLEVERRDSEDLLAPSPGDVGITLAQGAPFAIRIPLSVHGGGLSTGAVTLGAGMESSSAVTVTRSAGTQTGTQVSAGPTPSTPPGVTGITLTVTDPLVMFGMVSNLAPVALLELPWYRLRGGADAAVITLSKHFRDPDGDELSYTVGSENPDVVTVTVSGDLMAVSPVKGGSTTVTATATDPHGLSASMTFPVSVRAPIPGSFEMDVVVTGSPTETMRAAISEAAEWWMSILADMELPDVPLVGNTRLGCSGIVSDEEIGGAIDDLLVVVQIEERDGPGGILASARPCSVREGSMLPYLGVTSFDLDDMLSFEGTSELEEVILHEIGHVLGIGSLWPDFDLLGEPSLAATGEADTHFAGPLAIAAFDEAGGTSYTGKKVPVENRAGPGSGDSHWRQTVFRTELMTPYATVGVPDELSAITIQSLADLGYTVDVSLADPYTLPGAVAADEPAFEWIDLGDDVLKGTITVVDKDGRVVRTIER